MITGKRSRVPPLLKKPAGATLYPHHEGPLERDTTLLDDEDDDDDGVSSEMARQWVFVFPDGKSVGF